MSPKQNLNEDAEISDGEISVSSEQIRTVERMQRKSKEEKMDDDDLLNGPDVVDENELANAEKWLGSRNTSLTKEGMENDDANGDGRRNEEMMMGEGEVRDESMFSLDSTSQQQNVIGSRHPRRSLFGGPPYPESYSKFNPSNAPSNGPIDFGGGMDISLLSGSQNSSTISANYQTPVMSAGKAIRTIENNNSRRRLLGKPYIRIEPSDNGIGQSISTAKRNVNWGPRTPPENDNGNNKEAEETAEQRNDDSNSNVGNGNNSSTATVVPPTPNNSATNSGSSSSSTAVPSRRRLLSGTSRYDLMVKNVGEKRQKCQNVVENGRNANENGKNSANGRNLASGSGTSNDFLAKNGGEKRQKQRENVHENGRIVNENGRISANGQNKDKERIIKMANGTNQQQNGRGRGGLNLQLVDLRQEQEDDDEEELEEGEDREEELEMIDQIESEETNEENENEMAQNSSAANLNESSLNNHSWMYYDKKDKTPNGMNGGDGNRNQIIGGQQRQNGNVRNDEENAPPVIWVTGFDRNVDVNALAVRMAEAGKIVKLTVLHLPTPCTVASVEYARGEDARHAISINNDRFWQGYEMKCAFEERIELVDNAQSEAPAQNGRNAIRPSNPSNRNINTSNLHNQSFPGNRPNVRRHNERLNATFGGIGGQQQRGRNRSRSCSPMQMNRPQFSRSLGNRMHVPNRPPPPPQNYNRNIRPPQQAPQQNNGGPPMNAPIIGRNSRRDQFEHQQNNSFRPRPSTNTNGHHNQQRHQQYWEEIVTPSPPTTSNLQHQSRIIRTPWPRGNGVAGPSTSSNQNQPVAGPNGSAGRQNQRGEKRKMAEGPAVFFQR